MGENVQLAIMLLFLKYVGMGWDGMGRRGKGAGFGVWGLVGLDYGATFF